MVDISKSPLLLPPEVGGEEGEGSKPHRNHPKDREVVFGAWSKPIHAGKLLKECPFPLRGAKFLLETTAAHCPKWIRDNLAPNKVGDAQGGQS